MQVRYPIMPKEQSREIRRQIRRVFLEIWDPIGISHEPNAQNEYDEYVEGAFELLVGGAEDAALGEYLDWIVGRMGMDGSRARPDYPECSAALNSGILRFAQDDGEKLQTVATPVGKRV